eukprot:746771-Hanusia_phi.AAC.1
MNINKICLAHSTTRESSSSGLEDDEIKVGRKEADTTWESSAVGIQREEEEMSRARRVTSEPGDSLSTSPNSDSKCMIVASSDEHEVLR